jgi:hypothetical protein
VAKVPDLRVVGPWGRRPPRPTLCIEVREFPQLAELAAVGAGLGLAILLLVAGAAIRHALDRRRMAAWDAGWAVAERRWNRQRW